MIKVLLDTFIFNSRLNQKNEIPKAGAENKSSICVSILLDHLVKCILQLAHFPGNIYLLMAKRKQPEHMRECDLATTW